MKQGQVKKKIKKFVTTWQATFKQVMSWVWFLKHARRELRMLVKCSLRDGLGHAIHGDINVLKAVTQFQTFKVCRLFKGSLTS